MATAKVKEQINALIDDEKVKRHIHGKVHLPAVILEDTKIGNNETVKYLCPYCGHKWSENYQNTYYQIKQRPTCPKCNMSLSAGMPVPKDGSVTRQINEVWSESNAGDYNVIWVDGTQINGTNGIIVAEYDVRITFHYSDKPNSFTVDLTRNHFGFFSNSDKVIFTDKGVKTSKLVSNAFSLYHSTYLATDRAKKMRPDLNWLKEIKSFTDSTWLYGLDSYWAEKQSSNRKPKSEIQAEQVLAMYEIPEMPEVKIKKDAVFYRELSENLVTREHLMEYYCKSCGAKYTDTVNYRYSSTTCPNCGIRTGYGESELVCQLLLSKVAIIEMLDEKTVFIRCGTFYCKCDDEFNMTYERDENYRVFITLNPGKEPAVKFLVNEGYGSDKAWVLKKNYASDKFIFYIEQVELIREEELLKYTGFKEYLEKEMSDGSHRSRIILRDMISYIRFQSKYPVVEQLCKRGLNATLTDEMNFRIRNNTMLTMKLEEKKITDVLSLPERLIKFYLKSYDTHSRLEKFKKLYQLDNNVREEDIEWIEQNSVNEMQIAEVLNESPMSIMRLCEYLEHVRINQCFDPKNAIADWRDYLHAAKTIDVDLTDNKAKYPSSLKREHDRAIVKQKIILDSKKEEVFQKETENYGRLFSYKTKDYMIIPPMNMKDLFEEGRKLNHCVGSYSDRIIAGTSCIMFIRKCEEPDKPYYTIEINRSGEYVVQLRANSNRQINTSKEKDLAKFLREWAHKKNIALNGAV